MIDQIRTSAAGTASGLYRGVIRLNDRLPPFIAPFVLLFAAYTASAYIGLNWARVDGAASPVWPAAGIGIAGLLIGGARLWPAIFSARLLAAYMSGSEQPLWADISIASGNAISTLIAVLALRYSSLDVALGSLSSLLRYFVLGAALVSVIAGLWGAVTLSISSGLDVEQSTMVFIDWVVGAYVGTIVVGPLVQSWWRRALPDNFLYLLAILIATGLASWLIFAETAGPQLRAWHIVPLLIWAAFAFQMRGATAALLIASTFAVWGTTSGGLSLGEPWMGIGDRVAILQQFLAVVGTTMLLLAATDEERQRRTNESLRLALDATGQGTFEFDLTSNRVILDDRARRILDVGIKSKSLTSDLLADKIHPDDRSQVEEAYNEASAPHGSGQFVSEHRLVDDFGRTRWVHIHGRTSFLGWGARRRPLLIRGTVRDVTLDKEAELQVRESEKFARRILDNLFAFVGVMKPDGTLIEANRAPLEAAGLEPKDVIGKKFWDCFWWQHSESAVLDLKKAIAQALNGTPVRYDVQIQIKGGALMWIDFQLAPLYDGRGRITHLIPSGIDLSARKSAERESDRLSSILEASPDLVGISSREGTIQYLNPGGLRLLGYDATSDRFIGEPIESCHTPEAAQRLRQEALPTARREGVWLGETELRHADGHAIPASQVVIAHAGETGGVDHYSTIVRDMSEAKEAERHQALLLRELSHRVKNTLAVIQAIARQTLRDNVDPRRFVQVFGGRIASLAASHELLTDTEWRGASFRAIVDHQLRPVVGGEFHERVLLDGPTVRLPSETATQLGLLLHELATNAMKHGALSSNTGSIELKWRVDNPGRLVLEWTERGGPKLLAPPEQSGFGTKLIDLSAATVERGYTPDGLQLKLEIVYSPDRVDPA